MTIHVRQIETAKSVSESLSELFPESSMVLKQFYPAASEIYGQGQRAGRLYLIEFGAVRVYRLLADGRRQISEFCVSGKVFGFEAHGEHHFFAEAMVPTRVRVLRSCCGHDAAILPLALKNLVRAHEHLLVLGRQTAAERICAFLRDMAAERQGGLERFELAMSRTDIGDYLGLTIETVSRLLSKLKRRGIIKLPSLRSVEIVDWAALRSQPPVWSVHHHPKQVSDLMANAAKGPGRHSDGGGPSLDVSQGGSMLNGWSRAGVVGGPAPSPTVLPN